MCLAPTLKPTPIVEWLITKNEKNLLASIRTTLAEKNSGLIKKTISRTTPQLLETILSDEKFNSKESIDFKQVINHLLMCSSAPVVAIFVLKLCYKEKLFIITLS